MLRTGLAAVLVIALVLTVVVANASFWATRSVLERAAFAETVERGFESPELGSSISAALAEAVVTGLQRVAPSRIDDLATQVLGLPAGTKASAVEAALGDRINDEFDTAPARELRHDLALSLHKAVLDAAEGRPGLVTVRGDDVVVDADALVARIAAVSDPRIAAEITRSGIGAGGPVVVAEVAGLSTVRRSIEVMRALQLILPLLAVAVALLVVVLAHRRIRALGIVGLAVTAAGAASLALVWLGGRYLTGLPDAPVVRRLAGDLYASLLASLVVQAAALVAVGLVIALLAWMIGRRQRRRAVRQLVGPRVRD